MSNVDKRGSMFLLWVIAVVLAVTLVANFIYYGSNSIWSITGGAAGHCECKYNDGRYNVGDIEYFEEVKSLKECKQEATSDGWNCYWDYIDGAVLKARDLKIDPATAEEGQKITISVNIECLADPCYNVQVWLEGEPSLAALAKKSKGNFLKGETKSETWVVDNPTITEGSYSIIAKVSSDAKINTDSESAALTIKEEPQIVCTRIMLSPSTINVYETAQLTFGITCNAKGGCTDVAVDLPYSSPFIVTRLQDVPQKIAKGSTQTAIWNIYAGQGKHLSSVGSTTFTPTITAAKSNGEDIGKIDCTGLQLTVKGGGGSVTMISTAGLNVTLKPLTVNLKPVTVTLKPLEKEQADVTENPTEQKSGLVNNILQP